MTTKKKMRVVKKANFSGYSAKKRQTGQQIFAKLFTKQS